ncbi:transglutaminase domain-containing protein [Mycoplasma sp. Mirounga ES2805-ORL]|uniref:transglutaminase domain-containing protein n=1 Tax=Mycoplasma sp. Mirounga ES2805-ORL TaxID=754514 RepID=UPI00197C593A|nr:transglutaminase domain-containing protein [Mycoplasma sp. Mirounga ES2805-ORL]QSF13816.1 hypothetical protein JXZ90_00740 [Mycoplasma sp. Mirounga ES2805-ORL]
MKIKKFLKHKITLVLAATPIIAFSASCASNPKKDDSKKINDKKDDQENTKINDVNKSDLKPKFEYEKINDVNTHVKDDKVYDLYLKANRGALNYLNLFDKQYFLDWRDQLTKYSEEDKKIISNFVNTLDGISEAKTIKDKIRVIYSWIIKNVKYPSKTNDPQFLEPIKVFREKFAICNGYSNLYKAMLNAINVPSAVIIGGTTYGAHAWNAVHDGEKWFFSDATWGVKSPQFFDKSVEDFSKDHYSTEIISSSFTEENFVFNYHYGLSIQNIINPNKNIIIPTNYKGTAISSIDFTEISQNKGIEELNIPENIWKIIGTDSVIDGKGLEFQIRNSSGGLNLKNITVAKNNEYYETLNGVLYTKGLTKLICYPSNKNDEKFELPAATNWFDEKETFTNKFIKEISVSRKNKVYYSKNNTIFFIKDNSIAFKLNR